MANNIPGAVAPTKRFGKWIASIIAWFVGPEKATPLIAAAVGFPVSLATSVWAVIEQLPTVAVVVFGLAALASTVVMVFYVPLVWGYFRGPRLTIGPPTSHYFETTRLSTAQGPRVGFRILSVPIRNASRATASNVTVLIRVYASGQGAGVALDWNPVPIINHGDDPETLRPTGIPAQPEFTVGDPLDEGHGRWRELGQPSTQDVQMSGGDGAARAIDIEPDEQAHVLDLIATERPPIRAYPGCWLIMREPIEATGTGTPFRAGTYRLELLCRSPDFKRPRRRRFKLEIPPDQPSEGQETAPVLTR